jgi:hypothetical protein
VLARKAAAAWQHTGLARLRAPERLPHNTAKHGKARLQPLPLAAIGCPGEVVDAETGIDDAQLAVTRARADDLRALSEHPPKRIHRDY